MRSLIAKEPKSNLTRLLGSLFSLILLVVLLMQQGWQPIVESIRRVGTSSICIALAFIFLSRLAVGLRWYVILHGGSARVTLVDTLRLTFAGLFASNFLPTTIGGDVIRFAGGLRIGLDRVRLAASIVVDRLVGMIGMVLPLPIGIAALYGSINLTALSVGMPVVGAISTEERQTIGGKIKAAIGDLVGAFRLWLNTPRVLLGALGLSILHMLALFFAIRVLLQAMEISLDILFIGGLWSLIYFVTLLPISVNGLGLQEVSLSYVFGELGAIPMQNTLSLALILRVIFIMASLPGAFVAPGLLAYSAEVDLPEQDPDAKNQNHQQVLDK